VSTGLDFYFYFCREGATRSVLALRDHGLPTLSSLTTHTSSEFPSLPDSPDLIYYIALSVLVRLKLLRENLIKNVLEFY
jgi:hypothetical protein